MYATLLIILPYVFLIILGSEWTEDSAGWDDFFSYDYTNVMKGLCCILVVLVHVPEAFTNPIQKAIGGFSQVSVTLYFLFSAYGVLWGIKNRPDYLTKFWKHRVLALFIPYLISCGIKILLGYHPGSGGTFFVCVLLLFYCITYFAAKYVPKRAQIIIVLGVMVYSLLGSTMGIFRWPTQALGFAYGALLVDWMPHLKKWFSRTYGIKLFGITVLAGGLTLVYVLMGESMPRWAEITLQNIMVLFLILFVFCVTFRLHVGNRASKFLGRMSYDIFLYHGLVQTLLVSFTNSAWGVKLSSGAFIALMMAFSIMVSPIMNTLNRAVLKCINQ